MLGTMRTVAAAGMALATAGAAYAGGPDFRIGISLGGCRPVICPPVACAPVVRYRQETVCDTVPRTEVWYDACGHRHTRIVYEKVYRTVWVPVNDCDRGATIIIRDDNHWRHDRHGGWRDRDHDRGRRNDGHAGRGWDDRRAGTVIGNGGRRDSTVAARQTEPARPARSEQAAAAPQAKVVGVSGGGGAEGRLARALHRR